MKLYTFPGAPNPLRVDLVLAEKGVELDTVKVDLTTQEQLSPEYRKKNPNCDVPMLELPDGTCISQVPAVMMYLEQCFPDHPVYGTSNEQTALAMMWEHLAFQNGISAVADVLRNSSKAMANRAVVGPHNLVQIPELADRGRLRIQAYFQDMNMRLADNEFVAGDFFSVADITAWVACHFANWVKEQPPEDLIHLGAWRQRIADRPAFKAVVGAK